MDQNNNNNNNNNTNNDSNDHNDMAGMELFEEDIRAIDEFYRKLAEEESNKRAREEDSSDNEGPKSKRQREDNESSNSDDEEESESSNSVSDDGGESHTDRVNNKYNKRFNAIEDYKERNELLSETTVQDLMSKLDRGEIISEQEFETLKRTNSLMDQDILKDKDTVQRMILYEDFSASVQRQINDNNARIERHEKKMSDYIAYLDFKDEIARIPESFGERDDTSFNYSYYSSNSESNSGNDSNNNPDSNNNNPDSSNPFDPQGPNDGNDDNFDDFPPSFDDF